tara:strand:- start:110 stop:772 length:663 start_codon:yes stop_codon:yes gene_type:complete
MTKILIATPAYGGNVCAAYTESLLYTCIILSQKNIEFQVKFINNQIVTRARNMLAYNFMKEETFTHMLFIDADIVWSPEHVLMLLEHNLDCCIGIYPNKHYQWNNDKLILCPSSVIDKTSCYEIPNEHLIKIEKAATGFMLLKKDALKRIENDIEKFILPSSTGDVELYNYFDCNVVNNDYLTEDYYFSYLYKKNGGEIFADKRINLLHIGNHEYGSLIK